MNTSSAGMNKYYHRAWLIGTFGLIFGVCPSQAGNLAYDPSTEASDREAIVGGNNLASMPAQAVTNVSVQPEGDLVTVVVTGDGKLFHDIKRLDDNRVVLDFAAVSSALNVSVIPGEHPLLKRVRIGEHADKVRVVFDLSDHPVFTVASVGRDIMVTFKPAAGAQVFSTKSLSQTSEGFDGVRPRSSARTQARGAWIVGAPQAKFKVRTVQMGGESNHSDDVQAQDLVAGQTRYVGRRVSLDFQQADITNILRLIAEVSGFNIVVGESVKAKVTMKLVSVPWDQALDMLLKMNGLGMIRQGTIVWVDTLTNIAKQQDEEARAKEAKVKAEELVDRVFYVRNLPAMELLTSLRQYLSPRGVMTVSQGSNALIVRETETKLGIIKQLVDGLDLQVPQVQIEARIVQADTVYARGLGIQWGVQNGGFTNDSFTFFGNATGAFAPAGGTGSTTIPRDFIVNLPAQVGGLPAVPAIGYQFGKLAPGFALDLRLSAGELLGLTKVIASPKVTTLDKREAKISQGESIPFQTTSLQGTQTTFVDANLELNVTPQITSRDPKEEGKRIMMKVRATRNSVGARSNPAGPSIDRREATTQVLVRDGETMVIGGVFVDTQGNNVQGVPYLSRIPVLGWLFKNKSETVSKQELLIFLTPTVIRTT